MCAIDDVVFPNIGLWDFFRRRGTAYSVVCGKILPNFELIQAPKYIVTCKYEKDLIKKSRKLDDTLFPIMTLWELSVAMDTRVLTWSAPTPMMLQTNFDCNRPAGLLDIHIWKYEYGRTDDGVYY